MFDDLFFPNASRIEFDFGLEWSQLIRSRVMVLLDDVGDTFASSTLDNR